MKFRKKPVVIEAVKWNGSNFNELMIFVGIQNLGKHNIENSEIQICTLEDGNKEVEHIASKGDWIIKGIKGEFYPCKPDIFKDTYEEIKCDD